MKSLLKKIIPPELVRNYRLKKTEAAIQRHLDSLPAATNQPFESFEVLSELMGKYEYPAPYGYSPADMLQRGLSRAQEVKKYSSLSSGASTLEIGCGDGMVSSCLLDLGYRANALDQSDKWFDDRAISNGVIFHQTESETLPFEDSSMDFAFSYNAFEHIADPRAAVQELCRVVRPGGQILLSFGPLYNSAFGEHAYRSIPIPYCQILFGLDQLNQYCSENGLDRIDPNHVNRWSLKQFKALWDEVSEFKAKVTHYHEGGSISHTNLIQRFGGRFKAVSGWAREFLVSDIRVVLTRNS